MFDTDGLSPEQIEQIVELLKRFRRYFNDPRNERLEFVKLIDDVLGPAA